MKEINNKTEYDLNIPPIDFDKEKYRLDVVLDIRKFEIELYWKRATYFWTFIAAAFAGYGFSLTYLKNVDNVTLLKFRFIICCLGFIFSFGWLMANKGSKFWHVNWENHLNMLENRTIGPIHKTNIHKSTYSNLWNPTKAYACSVSKINHILSFFVAVVWLALISDFFFEKFIYITFSIINIDLFYTMVGTITIAFFTYLLFGTKSSLNDITVHFQTCELTRPSK
jgi:hypothetical protein